VSLQKGLAETTGPAAGERFPLPTPVFLYRRYSGFYWLARRGNYMLSVNVNKRLE
jgi:hypothetical protein